MHIKKEAGSPSKHAGLAVLLIDMQVNFVKGLEWVTKLRLLRAQSRILRECAEFNVPLVVLEYRYHGQTVELLKRLIDKVPRKVTIVKTDDDGFSEDTLGDALLSWNTRSIVMMGINASYCVWATSQSAVRRFGFKIFTADNLIADPKYCKQRNFSLSWYKNNGVYLYEPRSVEQILVGQ